MYIFEVLLGYCRIYVWCMVIKDQSIICVNNLSLKNYLKAELPEVERATFESLVQRPNQYTTRPHRSSDWLRVCCCVCVEDCWTWICRLILSQRGTGASLFVDWQNALTTSTGCPLTTPSHSLSLKPRPIAMVRLPFVVKETNYYYYRRSFISALPVAVQSIAISMSVCLFVCSLAYLSPNFTKVSLHVNWPWLDPSSYDSAMSCVLSVVWMTSCFHIMGPVGQNQSDGRRFVW